MAFTISASAKNKLACGGVLVAPPFLFIADICYNKFIIKKCFLENMQQFLALDALITGFITFAFGLMIIVKNPKNIINITGFFLTSATALWCFGYWRWLLIYNDADQALFWVRILSLGSTLIPLSYFHWIVSLLGLNRTKRKIILSAYAITGAVLFFSFSPLYIKTVSPIAEFAFWPKPGIVYTAYLFFIYIGLVFYGLFLLVKNFKQTSGIRRIQIKYVLLGSIFGFGGGATNFFYWYDINFPPLGNVLVILYPVIFSYAIIRYRLMDIRIVARKIFIYCGLAAFTYGMFYLVLAAYQRYLDDIFSPSGYLAGLIIAPLFVAALYGVKKIFQTAANRYFFASLYNYQETINKLTDELSNYLELDKITDLIVATIKKTMRLNRAGVLLADAGQNPTRYQIAKITGFNRQNGISLVQDNFLTEFLTKNPRPLVLDELSLLAKDAKTLDDRLNLEKLKKQMEKIEASLCLPLMGERRLIGLIVLGGKISGDGYTQEDLELLNTMSKQAGIAVENGRLYRQVRELNENLYGQVEEKTRDIKEKSRHLEELLNMKNDFLRVVNHQLNTPLSVMKGYYSLMEEGTFPPAKALPFVKAGMERISATVADFWQAYELEGEKMAMEPGAVDIAGLIEKLLPEKKQLKLAQDRQLSIVFQKPAGAAPKAWCDEKKITHVISNLLDNAVFYTRAGQITVSLAVLKKGWLKISVRDTGAGITAEDRPKMFQKFSRGRRATDFKPDGSGLGLFIAKKIVESNGGEISFQSRGANQGTTFSFTLPIYRGQADSRANASNSARDKIVIFYDNI